MTDLRPLPMWGGRRLRDWLLAGGPPDRPSVLLNRGRGTLFEMLLQLQRSLPDSGGASKDPVFMVGPWRTGSTLLHSLLALCPGLAAPTTWQCFHPASCRLVRPPRSVRFAVRPMDGMPVTSQSPQEDEFALLLMGAPSLYRGFLDPRRFEELIPLLAGSDADAFVAPLSDFLKAISGPVGQRPLLKSPNHLFRMKAIRATFPFAFFIATLRDPAETYWSNLRMWRDMAKLYGLWDVPEGAIERFLPRMISAAADRLAELATVDRLIAIRFEDLANDPAGAALHVADALGERVDNEIGERIRQAAGAMPRRTVTARDAVPPDAVAACTRLADAQELLLRAC